MIIHTHQHEKKEDLILCLFILCLFILCLSLLSCSCHQSFRGPSASESNRFLISLLCLSYQCFHVKPNSATLVPRQVLRPIVSSHLFTVTILVDTGLSNEDFDVLNLLKQQAA